MPVARPKSDLLLSENTWKKHKGKEKILHGGLHLCGRWQSLNKVELKQQQLLSFSSKCDNKNQPRSIFVKYSRRERLEIIWFVNSLITKLILISVKITPILFLLTKADHLLPPHPIILLQNPLQVLLHYIHEAPLWPPFLLPASSTFSIYYPSQPHLFVFKPETSACPSDAFILILSK